MIALGCSFQEQQCSLDEVITPWVRAGHVSSSDLSWRHPLVLALHLPTAPASNKQLLTQNPLGSWQCKDHWICFHRPCSAHQWVAVTFGCCSCSKVISQILGSSGKPSPFSSHGSTKTTWLSAHPTHLHGCCSKSCAFLFLALLLFGLVEWWWWCSSQCLNREKYRFRLPPKIISKHLVSKTPSPSPAKPCG